MVNNYFSTVGDRLAKKILDGLNMTESELSNNIRLSYSNSPAHSLFFQPTDENEVTVLINSLKSSQAVGHDNISNEILKRNKYAIAPPLTYLCNLSMSSGIVPDKLKIAEVIPIFKTGDALEPANYRPISLLSAVAKIIEKVVNIRLLKYLEKKQSFKS